MFPSPLPCSLFPHRHVFLGFYLLLLGVYAIIGQELFRGSLMTRCLDKSDFSPQDDKDDPHLRCGGERTCDAGYTCFLPGRTNDHNLGYLNPNYGISSFDHFYGSMTVVMYSATLEDWSNIMFSLADGYNYGVSALYFIFLVSFYGIFIVSFRCDSAILES